MVFFLEYADVLRADTDVGGGSSVLQQEAGGSYGGAGKTAFAGEDDGRHQYCTSVGGADRFAQVIWTLNSLTNKWCTY